MEERLENLPRHRLEIHDLATAMELSGGNSQSNGFGTNSNVLQHVHTT